MVHSIKNKFLEVQINETGAELMAITAADGTEYLWSGDKTYWGGHAPILFPYVGRLTDNRYTYCGKEYQMNRHGFARGSQFTVADAGTENITLRLEDSEESRAVYPGAFRFDVSYVLEDDTLVVVYTVENRGMQTMYFGLGAHPGFRVPLEMGKEFTDYQLTFGQKCQPWQTQMSYDYMISGHEAPYPLEDGTRMPLRHDPFDHDAIILKNMDRRVTLSAGEGTKGVTLSIPGMRYLGVWHTPETDAPFVCLEPWVSLPSRQGVVEDFSQQNDLVTLFPNERYVNRWTITVF